MTAKTQFASVKLPVQLVNMARQEAPLFSRSISGQLEHWAKIGQAIENMNGFTIRRARDALNGLFDPAELNVEERRYYYDLLDDKLATPDNAEIAAMAVIGQSAGAVGYNDAGHLVRIEKDGSQTVIEE
jgi:hypothetical protein